MNSSHFPLLSLAVRLVGELEAAVDLLAALGVKEEALVEDKQ